jgi:hypothetical protein
MWWIVMASFFLRGGISWLMELQGLEVYGYDALVDGYEMLLGPMDVVMVALGLLLL